ncbi:MAG TPA: hypothetical protein VIU29_01065 [Candidatus Deferrimicrobiaceae bacterium]
MAKQANIRMKLAVAILAMAAFSGGCGSGGTTTTASGPDQVASTQIFEWTPPATYFDNTPLNPRTDLDHYEIFVGSSPNFTDNDAPVAAVAAVTVESAADGRTIATATNSFNLSNLSSLVEPGKSYYVSVRAIGTDNLASSFSPAVMWEVG